MKHLRYLFKAKWTFKPPKKNKFVIVDYHNPFKNYLNEEDFTTLYRRGEEINFFVILKCVINFNLSSLGYATEFIKLVSPQLIFTAFDYHTIFYKISRAVGIKTIMVQKGQRSINEDIYMNSEKYFPTNSKEIFFVDYAFFHNEDVKKFYSRRIEGKFFSTGSFENNFYTLDPLKQKNEIIFVSNFNINKFTKSENENRLVYELSKLAKIDNIKFNILPRFRHDEKKLIEEKNFYSESQINNINFITEYEKTSYEILLNYKYVFASYSTLAMEFLSKGGQVGFLMFKSEKNPVYEWRFGKYEKLEKNGLFWATSNKFETKEIERVFNYVVKTNNEKWINETKKYIKKVLNFDENNQTFLNILKDLIK